MTVRKGGLNNPQIQGPPSAARLLRLFPMSSAKPVTDHSEIRRWAEANNARPACLKGTGKGKDPVSLRLNSTNRRRA